MARQTRAVVLAGLAIILSLVFLTGVGIPFVVLSPGATADLLATGESQPVRVSGATTFPTRGRLLLTTVSRSGPESRVSVLDALSAFWSADRDVVPWKTIYPPGATESSVAESLTETKKGIQSAAVAAALQAAKLPISQVAVVEAVSETGPSAGRLRQGDIVLAVDETPVQTDQDVADLVAAHTPGAAVRFDILRDGHELDVMVTAIPSTADPNVTIVGARVGVGFSHPAEIDFQLDPEIEGPGGGLMLALAVYAKVSPESLIGDRIVAGAGQVDGFGSVTGVSGIRQRVIAAERAGATVFLIPQDNCADLGDVPVAVRLVSVATVAEAIEALTDLADPAEEANVKGCR